MNPLEILALFRRQIGKCRSVNQFNRLHVAISNRITPLELVELGRAIEETHHFPTTQAWLRKLNRQVRCSGKQQPETFIRKRLRPNLFLYSGTGPTQEKTLAICFTGNARRLMMPLPIFLQHLDASRFDVLLIMRHGASRYSNGMRGLAGSFTELMEVLRDVIQGLSYKNVISYGTSAGGVPALLAALYLCLDKGIAVGASSLNADRWMPVRNEAWLRRAKDGWEGKPQLVAVFGADSEWDRNQAAEIRAVVPVALCPLEGENEHGALMNFVNSGRFKDLLESLLTVYPSSPPN